MSRQLAGYFAVGQFRRSVLPLCGRCWFLSGPRNKSRHRLLRAAHYLSGLCLRRAAHAHTATVRWIGSVCVVVFHCPLPYLLLAQPAPTQNEQEMRRLRKAERRMNLLQRTKCTLPTC